MLVPKKGQSTRGPRPHERPGVSLDKRTVGPQTTPFGDAGG